LICGILNAGYLKRTLLPSKDLTSLKAKTIYGNCSYKASNLNLEEYNIAKSTAGAPQIHPLASNITFASPNDNITYAIPKEARLTSNENFLYKTNKILLDTVDESIIIYRNYFYYKSPNRKSIEALD